MPLTLRPTSLGSGIDKDRPDYTVFTGEWEVGHIYETRGGLDNLRGSRADLAAARSRKLGRRRSADRHGLRQCFIVLRRLRAVHALRHRPSLKHALARWRQNL